MTREELEKIDLSVADLARLTGQAPNSVYRKLNQAQGMKLGAREAGVIAAWSVMTAEQRRQTLEAFDAMRHALEA